MRKYSNRKDGNHKEIVNGLRKFGAVVLDVSNLPNLFDILVCYNGITHIVEIKNPETKHKLTGGELECKNLVESVGVTYHVIYSLSEIIEILK